MAAQKRLLAPPKPVLSLAGSGFLGEGKVSLKFLLGPPLLSIVFSRFPLLSLGCPGFWFCTVFVWFAWFSMGLLWFPLASLGFPWLPLAFLGFPGLLFALAFPCGFLSKSALLREAR